MSENLLLPIELTKILYSEWQGQLQIADDETQLYGKSLNGPCKVTFKNGNKYEGDFKNGLLHGKGKFIWANGIIYEGDFKNNKLEGVGTYKWTDGAIYEGEVQNGLRHGTGKLTLDVCTYQGQWKNGNRHGEGKITFSNGGVYEGEFELGVKSGKGRMYYPSGNYYQGQWKNDLKNGQGIMKWMDSHQKYTGQWLNNLQHGFGTHIWLDGRGQGKYMRNRYQGQWKVGLRDGFGIFYYANGSKYQGQWANNMKQGTAIFTNQQGNLSKVQFSKDRLVKQGGLTSTSFLDGKTKSSFIPNNKQIQSNPYLKMIDFRPLYLPQTPSLQQHHNFLLRNNSQIKTWYKNLSLIYDSKSELTFSLTYQALWKITRSLKILGKLSLARIDRQLAEVKLSLKNVVEQLKSMKQQIVITDIKYIIQSLNMEFLQDSLDKKQNTDDIQYYESQNIHDGSKIVLLKDFVLYLIILSLQDQDSSYKSMQKLFDRIAPVFDSISKNERKSFVESKSQNFSTLSKADKNIPLYAKNINTNLFNKLTQRTKFSYKLKMQDRSIKFSKLLNLFRSANLFNDSTDPVMLQRFLDKNMDSEYLNSPVLFDTKLNSKFSLTSDYQLIQFQFVQLLFYYLIKKLPSTKQTEQNKQKYSEFISRISQAFDKLEYQQANYLYQNNNIRIIQSSKMKQKQELLKKRKIMNEIKQKKERIQKQKDREEKERLYMEANDFNVMSQQFESEDDEYSEY